MYRRHSAAIYIMVVKFRNTIWPPPPQLSLHRRAALSSNSNGTRSFIAERTQNPVYIVRCLWYRPLPLSHVHQIWPKTDRHIVCKPFSLLKIMLREVFFKFICFIKCPHLNKENTSQYLKRIFCHYTLLQNITACF
jgi:hypothetical protein